VAGGLEGGMSGICAVWQRARPHDIGRTLKAVTAGLSLSPAERPHQETDQGAGIGVQARFAGSQQIFRNGRLILACDAELLNDRELRMTVEAGDPAAGPAALLAALYEKQGDSFVDQLRGGFSVALWDLVERRFLAAIDRFGIKRLSWYDDGKVLVIASRLNAVREGTGVLPINPRAVANVLNFSADLAPETIFVGVHRLGPGMLIRGTERETRTAQYWDMQYEAGPAQAGEEALSRELESVVERSVAAHCAGDAGMRPGAFLSGGTDSSTVVGMMTRALGAPVKTFSIGFQEQRFNELHYADTAARAFGAEHHTYLVSARDCQDALPGIVGCFDEPFGNASAVATYFCARLAADNGVNTLLAGDGGDELFGGNERYATEHLFEIYHRVPRWLRTSLIEPIAAVRAGGALTRKARGYIRRANMPGVERMFSFAFLRAHPPEDVFTSDFLRSLGNYNVIDIPARHYAQAPAREHLNRLLYVDMKVTLADNDLPKVTCVSELAGIRTRFPFLDREVAEFSGRLPVHLKVKGFKKRYLFKRAFRQLLPEEIIRKKKHGFGIPVASWIKSDPQLRQLARDTLLSSRASGRGYFRREFVQELLNKHDQTENSYYGDVLWVLLMVELWHEQFVDHAVQVATRA
jgi:asparagine synthase (glutamine-hydrolysing)